MLRRLLSISVITNVLLISAAAVFAFKRHERKQTPPAKYVDTYNLLRSDVLGSLPITPDDIVFVGNSITEGFPVTELYGAHAKNRGIGGNTTIEILARLPAIASGHPKKIFLDGGINDIRAGVTADSIVKNFTFMIDTMKALSPKTAVIIQSIFPTNDRIEPKLAHTLSVIMDVNDRLQRLAEEKGVKYLDLFPLFGGALGLDSSITADGLHLNSRGYSIWKKGIDALIN